MVKCSEEIVNRAGIIGFDSRPWVSRIRFGCSMHTDDIEHGSRGPVHQRFNWYLVVVYLQEACIRHGVVVDGDEHTVNVNVFMYVLLNPRAYAADVGEIEYETFGGARGVDNVDITRCGRGDFD